MPVYWPVCLFLYHRNQKPLNVQNSNHTQEAIMDVSCRSCGHMVTFWRPLTQTGGTDNKWGWPYYVAIVACNTVLRRLILTETNKKNVKGYGPPFILLCYMILQMTTSVKSSHSKVTCCSTLRYNPRCESRVKHSSTVLTLAVFLSSVNHYVLFHVLRVDTVKLFSQC